MSAPSNESANLTNSSDLTKFKHIVPSFLYCMKNEMRLSNRYSIITLSATILCPCAVPCTKSMWSPSFLACRKMLREAYSAKSSARSNLRLNSTVSSCLPAQLLRMVKEHRVLPNHRIAWVIEIGFLILFDCDFLVVEVVFVSLLRKHDGVFVQFYWLSPCIRIGVFIIYRYNAFVLFTQVYG